MKLNRITITGADGSDRNINPFRAISDLSSAHPYVEWGLLVTKGNGNQTRFVQSNWIGELMEVAGPLNYSMHICGGYVRDMCRGEPSFLDFTYQEYMGNIRRIQLNFSCYMHLIDRDRMLRAMKTPELENKQFILQFSEPDFELVQFLRDAGVDAVPFFDRSGGRGKVPDEWPKPMPGVYSGYSGGLNSKNIEDELKRISRVVGQSDVWIDIETGVRSDRNVFDFNLASRFLEKCKPWMNPESLKPVCYCTCGWSGKEIVVGTDEERKQQGIVLAETYSFPEITIPMGNCPNCGAYFLSFDRPFLVQDESYEEDDDWVETEDGNW